MTIATQKTVIIVASIMIIVLSLKVGDPSLHKMPPPPPKTLPQVIEAVEATNKPNAATALTFEVPMLSTLLKKCGSVCDAWFSVKNE